jgi:hypothetical protein
MDYDNNPYCQATFKRENSMGHSQIQKRKNHERIVRTASKRFREKGLEGVGIASGLACARKSSTPAFLAMVAEMEGDVVWTESIVERQSKRRLQPLPPWRATRQRLEPSVTSKAGRFAYIRGAHMLKHRKEAARPAAPDARERIPTGAGAARPDHFSGAYQRFNSNRKQMPFGTSLLERFLDRSDFFMDDSNKGKTRFEWARTIPRSL